MMREVERRAHLLRQDAAGVIVDARAALFEDDLALGGDVVLGQPQIGHAVGLHPHDQRQPVLGDALEVGRRVMGGEGVVLAAIAGDELGKLARRDLFGALEHQMFEEMRDAGFALRLVGGPDLVPHHLRDNRRAAVGDDDHLHAVGKRCVGHIGTERRYGRCGTGRGRKH